MDIKNTYDKLYRHWLKEFQQTEITKLTNEEFNSYKKNVDYIAEHTLEKTSELSAQIIDSYKKKFTYLFEDFSKLREIKIINTALKLEEIDLTKLLEAEKLFYNNLVSAQKGFKKVKAMQTVDEYQIIKEHERIEYDEVEEKELEQEIVLSSTKQQEKDEDYEYTVIKLLQPAPALVGIDLIKYGPFEKEDVVNLPYKNAKILIYEKIAEKLDIN